MSREHRYLSFGNAATKRFVVGSARFAIGLAVVLALSEVALARYNAHSWGYRLIGREVFQARRVAQRVEGQIHTLYLGDSVAHQLFPLNYESDGVRSLTTNQAISVAGQYYLLREALATHRGVREVVLFYSPRSFENNLDQVFTEDYYCGYFHHVDQVFDTFAVTGSWPLLLAHSRRAILPNLSAMNSWFNQSGSAVEEGEDPNAPLTGPIVVSHVSRHFLSLMYQLASRAGIRLRVLPMPVSDQFHYFDTTGIYGAPILYLPKAMFKRDTIHVEREQIDAARQALTRHLALAEHARDQRPPG